MIPRSLGLTVLAAAAANAFMIPSTMSLPDVQGDGGYAVLREASPVFRKGSEVSLSLDCTGCAFPDPSNNTEWKSDVNNALLLIFGLSEDRTMLILNKVPFYPFSVSLSHPVYASQLSLPSFSEDNVIDVSTAFKMAQPRQLFYGAGFRTTDAADGTTEKLIDLDFAITSLDQEHVDLDGVTIRLFEDGEGKLAILHVRTIPRANARVVPSEVDQGSSCGTGLTSFLCRWRAVLESKLFTSARRPGCTGIKRHGPPFIKGGPSKFWQLPTSDDGTPPPHPPYHHHNHHHNHHHYAMHRVGSTVRYVIVAIVIPVLVGAAAGIIASMLGMMVGTAIAWLWIKFIRGGHKGRASLDRVALAAKEEIFVESDGLLDEKHDYMVEEVEVEAPPGYVEKE